MINSIRTVQVDNDITIGENNSITFIAGPCVIEDEQITLYTATHLKNIADEFKINFIFKASFDKANRSSIHSYRGMGIDRGLEILGEVKRILGVPVLTDIHESWQCEKVAEVVDILQIPAFLCRQTDLLIAAAKTGKVVNVKKGQFLSPADMKHIVIKLEESGTNKILLTERGTTFGYNNLVVDMRSLVEMRKHGYPVIFDATHSVQRPGGNGSTSSGDRQFVPYLMRAAAAVGVDGIFAEVHPEPEKALSDGANMLRLSEVKKVLKNIIEINDLVKETQ